MRNILLLSIVLNLGLVSFAGYHFFQRNGLPENKTVPSESNNPPQKFKTARVQTATETVTNIFTSQFSWEKIEAEDYKLYIANLRSIECPEETIRDIIIADVNKYYAKKLAPLRRSPPPENHYWRNQNNWGGYRESAEFYAKSQEIEKEKRELLRELLGIDYLAEMRKQSGWYQENSFTETLPQETKDQLQEVRSKFELMRSEIHRKARGYIDNEDQKELSKIEKQMHDEMAKLLSPEQLFEYQLRHSSIASNLKNNDLQGFSANEEEFRAIFRAKYADQLARDEDDSSGPASSATRAEKQKAAEEQLRTALGKERYDEFKLSQDWEYRNLAQLVERQELPRSTAKEVHNMKAEVEKATRMLQSNRDLTAEQRKEQLKLIRAETEKAITELLGEKGFKSYKRNAWWIRNISPN